MTDFPMPETPRVKLPNVSYDEVMGYNARTRSFQVTGTANIATAIDNFATWASTTYADRTVAMDIETRGADSDAWWEITCLTAAFHTHIGVVSVLFDPLRNMEHRKLIRRLVDLAERLVFHNHAFDIPPLVAHRVLTLDDVNKAWDTLVLAKMIRTSDRAGRSLEDLAVRYGIVPDDGISMARVFSASGYSNVKEGFSNVDLHSGTYRDGAMSDTVVTLRLLPILEQAVIARHDASTGSPGAVLSTDEAKALVQRMQRVAQICARRAARGFRFDPEFPEVYQRRTQESVEHAVAVLTAEGLEPGRGDHLVDKLHNMGQLPDDWPRTTTGRLSADKKAMAKLVSVGHPLAEAHITFAETTKVTNYLTKIVDQGRATGRVHPSIGVLAASASGRMAISNPELHQFPGSARGIILADGLPGWSSVDWSSIEPVVMAACAGDNDFITPFYQGQDLYIPVARTAGLIPPEVNDEDAAHHSGRKVSKVLLLAGMYGQGIGSLTSGLENALKRTVPRDEARALSDSFRSAMPVTFAFMKNLEGIADGRGCVTTIAGRVLDEDKGYSYRAVNHFCITPDTPILTADLTHVRADSVRVGDELVGFDEYRDEKSGQGSGKRRFRTAVVKNVNNVLKPSVEVHTEDGKVTVCSADHRWLVRGEGGEEDFHWVTSEHLLDSHELLSLGTLHPTVLNGALVHTTSLESTPRVVKVVPVGDREVVAIETSTHTFIANGYLSHNCQGSAADVLYDATLRLDDAGLSDHIHLWMHDELVVSSEVQAEVEEVMKTPPESLQRWARTNEVKLRIDANPMGLDWKSV